MRIVTTIGDALAEIRYLEAEVAKLNVVIEAYRDASERNESIHLARIAELEQQLSAFEEGLLLPFSELAKLHDYDDEDPDDDAHDTEGGEG